MRRVLGLFTAVACGEVLLLAAGSGGPRLAEPGSWSPWLATRPPEEVVFAVVRGIGLVAGAYLLVVLGAGVLLRLCRARSLVGWANGVTPSSLRTLLDRAVVVATAVTVTATMGPTAAAVAGEGPPITLRGLQGPTRSTAPTTTTTVLGPPPTVLAEEPVTVPTGPVTSAARPSTSVAAVEAVEPVAEPPPVTSAPPARITYDPAPPPTHGRTWTVRRGDHFWSIAEQVLAEARGRAVTGREVAPYWQALVAENRSRLADPDNADLLFAGQVLALPEVG